MVITKKQKLFLLTLVLILFSVWLWWWLGELSDRRNEVGTDASAALTDGSVARYTTLDGESYDFSGDRGTIRVITLWASWSPFSKKDFATLEQLAEEFDNQSVRFIALNRSESLTRAEAYLRQYPLADAVTVVVDPNDNLYQEIEGYAMPETIIFDETGTIANRFRGVLPLEAVRTELRQLLEE